MLFRSERYPAMLAPLSQRLQAVDDAVSTMNLCCAYVFSLPDEAAHEAAVAHLRDAVQRVAAQWPLLQGKPVWLEDVSRTSTHCVELWRALTRCAR